MLCLVEGTCLEDVCPGPFCLKFADEDCLLERCGFEIFWGTCSCKTVWV